MIKFTDAALLAFTKLRARKVRTITTALLASLLFGILVAASLIATGGFRSIDDFRADGLTSRYIVRVAPAISGDVLQKTLRNPELITEAKLRYEKMIATKMAEAERLGLPYTQASDQPPYIQSIDGQTERLNFGDKNGIVRKLLSEKFAGEPAIDDEQLKSVAARYGSIDMFSSTYETILRGSTLEVFADGQERFFDSSDENEARTQYRRSLVDGGAMTLTPVQIADSFLLPGNAGWQPDGKTVPIVVTQNIAEQLLKLRAPKDAANATEKLDYLKLVREKAAALSFQACYRNDSSTALIQQAVQQRKQMKVGAANKDYEAPPVIYALPDSKTCDNPRIVSDTRTSAEIERDNNQKEFDRKFNNSTDPVSYPVTFKVVGISPAQSGANGQNSPEPQAGNAGEIIDRLLRTSGVGQIIPQSLYNQLSDDDKKMYADIFTYTPLYIFGNEDNKERFVEFANASDAQRFISEQGCTTQADGGCAPVDHPYHLSLSFTNSAALEDIQAISKKWFGYAMIGIIILAAVIMWITISRTIADGRRETAVFRAIGFKRGDISAVYILYTLALSALIALFAGIIGWVGAFIVNQQLSPELTAQAQNGFGGLDLTKEINLIGIDWQQLVLVLVACFVTGVLSLIVPLMRNVRRNPIRDMREE